MAPSAKCPLTIPDPGVVTRFRDRSRNTGVRSLVGDCDQGVIVRVSDLVVALGRVGGVLEVDGKCAKAAMGQTLGC